ncbi:MAG: ferrochelatase, partial [Bacteroidales bacterium]|nr:ferrochelatase [Bacteroidales bacterium]
SQGSQGSSSNTGDTGNPGSVSIRTIDQFYNHPGFIASFAERIQVHDLTDFDHILFSYHGLPLRQLQKVHPEQPVADCNCHLSMPPYGHHCYRATCYTTTRLLATATGITPDRCSTSFQSRLSRNWMTPFTDESLIRLAAEGKKKVLVVPASFVADCLETTLEIGMEYRELYIENGGEELVMAESLNSSDRWMETVKALMQKTG